MLRELAWWELHRAMPRVVLAQFATLSALLAGAAGILLYAMTPALRPAAALAILAHATVVPIGGLAIGLAGPPSAPAHLAVRRPGGGRERLFPVRSGFAIGIFVAIAVAPVGGVWLALAVMIVGIVGGELTKLLGRPDPISATSPQVLHSGDGRTLVALVAGGGVAGAISGLLAGALVTEFPYWFLNGLANALVFGLAGYVVARSRNPRPGRVGIERMAAGLGALIGAGLGGSAGLIWDGDIGGLPVMVVSSLVGGLGLGLIAALALTASGWYTFTHMYLALRRRLPWRLMTFLRDAQRRGVLRQTGGVYQFRHARLQDRLASKASH